LMAFKSVIESKLDVVVKLDAEMIAPSHGPIYRQPGKILDAYREWISAAPKKSIVIPYVSMHGSTRLMVDYLVEACAERGIHAEQFNLAEGDIGRLAISLVDAAGIVLGSPMLLGGPHPKVAYAAILANTLRPKAKFLAVIGSFGWGGRLEETLQLLMPNLKAELLPPVLAKGLPGDTDYAALDALADAISARCSQPGSQPQVKAQPAATTAPALTKYMCPVCRYVYDPAKGDPAGGIPPGTPFESLPDNWVCPICRVPKRVFKPI
jgi:flavorubredoxin/rubredoxin